MWAELLVTQSHLMLSNYIVPTTKFTCYKAYLQYDGTGNRVEEVIRFRRGHETGALRKGLMLL